MADERCGAVDANLRHDDSRIMAFVRRFYDGIRPLLPKKFASYGGIPVRDRGLFDRHDMRAHKIPGQELIADVVHPGDHVVDIGAGHSAFAVRAAWQGSDIEVDAYDGARTMVEKARETAAASFVSDRVTVHHTIIGESNDLFGVPDGAETVSPVKLPDCDVLISDCEGTERNILSEMSIRPRELVVECHPEHDSPPEDVCDILETKGYETRITAIGRPFVHGRRADDA